VLYRKKKLKMDIRHGDILVTACYPFPGVPCQHRAIVFLECGEWWVFQNTPGLFNRWGGNIVQQRLEEFLENRKVWKVINAKMDIDCVRRYNHENRERRWHVLLFNCEDYVNQAASGKKFSQLRRKYLAAGIVGALLLSQ
jgi:hypothetical protein